MLEAPSGFIRVTDVSFSVKDAVRQQHVMHCVSIAIIYLITCRCKPFGGDMIELQGVSGELEIASELKKFLLCNVGFVLLRYMHHPFHRLICWAFGELESTQERAKVRENAIRFRRKSNIDHCKSSRRMRCSTSIETAACYGSFRPGQNPRGSAS